MEKQIIKYAVEKKDGVIKTIGKCIMEIPKTNFKGGAVKWYEDKPKTEQKERK